MLIWHISSLRHRRWRPRGKTGLPQCFRRTLRTLARLGGRNAVRIDAYGIPCWLSWPGWWTSAACLSSMMWFTMPLEAPSGVCLFWGTDGRWNGEGFRGKSRWAQGVLFVLRVYIIYIMVNLNSGAALFCFLSLYSRILFWYNISTGNTPWNRHNGNRQSGRPETGNLDIRKLSIQTFGTRPVIWHAHFSAKTILWRGHHMTKFRETLRLLGNKLKTDEIAQAC